MAGRRGGDAEQLQLGGYWLGREPSGYIRRYWYDPRTGRVRRKSLKTKDWEEAAGILAALVVTQPRVAAGGGVPDPAQVLLVTVLNHYVDHRAVKIRTGEQAERAVELLTQFLFDVKKLPETAKADAFGLDLQQDYVKWLAATFGHSASYIARLLNPIASAMHFAAAEQAIEADEGTRTVKLMSYAPKVRYGDDWIAETAAIPPPQKRSWVPTIEEMARFIDCLGGETGFRFTIIALNTWARPEAILELDLKRQVIDKTLLDLNPADRAQTKKRRPIIRITRNLAAWIAEWNVGRPLGVGSIKKAIELASARWMMKEAGWTDEQMAPLFARYADKARFKAMHELEAKGGHRITPRIFRTFMATRVRNQREVVVEDLREQRQVWLGHQDQDTTARYEIMDPDYLRECSAATDLIIEKIGKLTRARSLWPRGAQPELPLLKVVGR
jgi:integrase